MDYEYWNDALKKQEMGKFNESDEGLAWLKIRSIERKDIQPKFISECGLEVNGTKLADKSKELYAQYLSAVLPIETINAFLKSYNSAELKRDKKLFSKVESDLYKVQQYAWGGDANNSLDKQIVSFIKNTPSYNAIVQKIDNEIHEEVRRYTLNSWYNNWSAILTENIFKEHPKVLSSIGRNKSVDFFIDDIPVDLKITFLPKAFIAEHRRKLGYKDKVTLLKRVAREHGIKFDRADKNLEYQLTQQLKDLGQNEIDTKLAEIEQEQNAVIKTAVEDKQGLIKWLYENQGAMRFGAENRLYLVLIDTENLENAWQLKRNLTLLRKEINSYLDSFDKEKFLKQRVQFSYNAKKYAACSEIIYIAK